MYANVHTSLLFLRSQLNRLENFVGMIIAYFTRIVYLTFHQSNHLHLELVYGFIHLLTWV